MPERDGEGERDRKCERRERERGKEGKMKRKCCPSENS
jgi:hypothetical protein